MSTAPESVRVLHVDDEPDLGDLVAKFLEREHGRFEVATATTPSDALDRLGEGGVDCVVSDYDMPGTDGIQFLEAVRDEHPDLPFILFTGKGSEEIASEAISAGVSDYLQKETGTEQYAVLANRIRNLVTKQRAESRLETRVRQQEIVTELGQDALSGADVQSLLDAAVEAVANALDIEFVKVLDYRPGDDDLFLRAGVGWRDGLVDQATVDTGRGSPAAYALRTEEPVVVEDLDTEERFSGSDLLLEHGVVSGISVIVGDPDDPWGVLGAHATDRRRFTEEDENFVQSVANVLATAIERVEHERALRTNERRFEAIFEDPNILVGLLEPDGTVLDVNRTAMEYVDVDLEAVIGEPFWETPWWRGDEDRSDVRGWVERAAAGEYVEFEADLARPDGRPFSISGVFRPVTDDEGEVVSIVVSDRDVTERKRRERELETVREQMEFALDATDSYIFAIDLETGEETRHGVFERIHGIDPASVPTAEAFYERTVHPEDRAEVERTEREAVHGHTDGTVEFEYRTHPDNGPVEWIRSEAYVRAGEDGEPEHLIGLATAITGQKRRERELERQNERLEEFARVVSHDLQNPLNVATGRLNLVREDCESEHLEDVARAHERIRVLIDDLLATAREGSVAGAVEAVALPTAVAESWRTVETGGASLSVDTDRVVRADESRLRQLLENLFRNAVEHNSTSPRSTPSREDAVGHGGDAVAITVGDLEDGFFVEDDGVGIPPEHRDRVFESEFSTAPRGTGFGLSIVEGIVAAHGWEIRATEGDAGGARFEVTGVSFDDE